MMLLLMMMMKMKHRVIEKWCKLDFVFCKIYKTDSCLGSRLCFYDVVGFGDMWIWVFCSYLFDDMDLLSEMLCSLKWHWKLVLLFSMLLLSLLTLGGIFAFLMRLLVKCVWKIGVFGPIGEFLWWVLDFLVKHDGANNLICW